MMERPKRLVCEEKIILPNNSGFAVCHWGFCALAEGHPLPHRTMDDLKHEHRFTVPVETESYPPADENYPTTTNVIRLRCETCREIDSVKP